MTKFKVSDFKVSSEVESLKEMRVIKLDLSTAPVVKDYEFNQIKEKGEGQYSSVKSKYGPLAATDLERNARNQKDRRFSLNSLLRNPLSIEQEERRVIEEKVRARIEALAEDAKTAAEAVGYQDGLKKGFEEAFKKNRSEGAASLERFNRLVEEAENAKVEIFRANERFLIELIYKISRMVLLRELTTDREFLLRLARELVNRVGVRNNVTLKINPKDAQTIEMLKDGLKKAFGEMSNLNIEASSQVKEGGCQIETEWNAIDASLEVQLQGLYDSLVARSSGGGS